MMNDFTDTFDEDPAYAIGTLVPDIALMFVPGGAAVKGVRVLGGAKTVVRARGMLNHLDDVTGQGVRQIEGVGGGKKVTTNGKEYTVESSKVEDAKKPLETYKRPSGYRKGVREKVWESARGDDGVVRDPSTNKIMKEDEPWDMGHKPGHEFKKHQKSAIDRDIDRKQFLDEHNNADSYRPEIPSSNRSHVGEDNSGNYFGP